MIGCEISLNLDVWKIYFGEFRGMESNLSLFDFLLDII